MLACARGRQAYYWRTQAGAELDLLLLLRNRRIGVEVKYGAAPVMTRSMNAALHDLALDRLFVVHAGEARYPLHERVEALPLAACMEEISRLA